MGDELNMEVAPRAMRSVLVTLEKLIRVVPHSEAQFMEALLKLQMTAQYVAPEVQPMVWMELGEIMGRYLPDPGVLMGWQKTFVNIFMGRDSSQLVRPDASIQKLDQMYECIDEEGLDRNGIAHHFFAYREYCFALESEVERLKEFEFLYGKERRIVTL